LDDAVYGLDCRGGQLGVEVFPHIDGNRFDLGGVATVLDQRFGKRLWNKY